MPAQWTDARLYRGAWPNKQYQVGPDIVPCSSSSQCPVFFGESQLWGL